MTKTAKNAVFYILMAIIGGILYGVAHRSATVFRGYEAIGGEIFMLLLPVIVYLFRVCIGDIINDFRKEKRHEHRGSSVPEQE